MASNTPPPQQIATFLSGRVTGQQEAITEVSIVLAKRLGGLPVGNVLMIGSSGTGKTALMRAVEAYLEEATPPGTLRPIVVRIHANVLGEEAEQGRPGEVLMLRLLERAREVLGAMTPADTLLEHASRGLVFVDEIDKIRTHVGDEINTAGIRAQEALLTVMENEAVPFTLPAWAGGETRIVDSSGLIFVCAGAFEGLYDAVLDRVTIGRGKGSLRPMSVLEDGELVQRIEFTLRDYLRHEDLFDYGVGPQFLARFDAVVLLNDLDEQALAKIFLEAPDSGYRQAKAYFESRNAKLELSDAAVQRIAREASRSPRLGARALREVFRRVVRGYEFEPDRFTDSSRVVHIDTPEVEAALKR
ncbi:MAG: AAA family ATPase [Planctomycetota bacterium]|jgi:ATP-dependent Clp protease ATP-binding subunit ClpX